MNYKTPFAHKLFLLFVVTVLSTVSVIAQRPGGTPNPNPNGNGALSEVTTDSTLTGKGTTVSPLKVADGAITAPKLGTTNAAQAGQVLTFNGTGLSWQQPAGGQSVNPLRILDSNNAEVGLTSAAAPYQVIRFIPQHNEWIQFNVSKAGVSNYDVTERYYETTDCTGTIYLYFGPDNNSLYQPAYTFGTNLIFAVGTSQNRIIKSFVSPSSGPGCHAANIEFPAYTAALIPFSEMGAPPFRLAR